MSDEYYADETDEEYFDRLMAIEEMKSTYRDQPPKRYCEKCGRPTSEPHCGYGTSWQ